MTASEEKDREGLQRLDKALIEDILTMSDDEIQAEVHEAGDDPEAVAAEVRALFEKTVIATKKARLAAAKTAAAADRSPPAPDLPSDPTEARRLLERVLASHQDLTTAARKGRDATLSDEEVFGLLQDFRDIGIPLNEEPGEET
jgi:hypothetical protein